MISATSLAMPCDSNTDTDVAELTRGTRGAQNCFGGRLVLALGTILARSATSYILELARRADLAFELAHSFIVVLELTRSAGRAVAARRSTTTRIKLPYDAAVALCTGSRALSDLVLTSGTHHATGRIACALVLARRTERANCGADA